MTVHHGFAWRQTVGHPAICQKGQFLYGPCSIQQIGSSPFAGEVIDSYGVERLMLVHCLLALHQILNSFWASRPDIGPICLLSVWVAFLGALPGVEWWHGALQGLLFPFKDKIQISFSGDNRSLSLKLANSFFPCKGSFWKISLFTQRNRHVCKHTKLKTTASLFHSCWSCEET